MYNPNEIEKKWQNFWDKNRTFNVVEDTSKPKFYCLEMLPYPSGKLHMGHVRNYTIGDALARYKVRQGFNVLHPIGWDAFGLPAENAAIKHNREPREWTESNIKEMKRQLKELGISYDWDREIATFKPEYYKWEQKIFTEMYKNGLVYKKKSQVNWCEHCNTVLANEQVQDGTCWRCGTEVITKDLEQWFFKITDYAEELLEYIDKLPGWPDRVRNMQRNWIGKSYGVELNFNVKDSDLKIPIYTTRIDTVYGVTFLSLAPEHPLVKKLVTDDRKPDVDAFIQKVRKTNKIERTAEGVEKEGVFTGSYAVNPLNGEEVPIYLANFVLMDYGTGAVMAVPAHDTRDFAFAKKYNIPIKRVIYKSSADEPLDEAYTEVGTMVNSAQFSGLSSKDAIEKIADYVEEQGLGKKTVNYRLKDWGISRQRYWGTPIPIIYCDKCGTVPVPEKDLPVVLPDNVKLSGAGDSPLGKVEEFVNTKCPVCGGPAHRDVETMDTFVESSWYYLRYTDPKNDTVPFDKEKADYWVPVDQYIGGIEHAVMHLLYVRFYHKVLRDLGYLSTDEPVKNLLTQGMVIKDGSKMSKSKGNVVDPEYIIERYGTDTARLFILFAAPPEKDLDWSDKGIEGAYRFLNRVYRFVDENIDSLKSIDTVLGTSSYEYNELSENFKSILKYAHKTLKKVTEDIEGMHFNTAIASLMSFVNELYKLDISFNNKADKLAFKESVEVLLSSLYVFAPHLASELWQMVNASDNLATVPWPSYNTDFMKDAEKLVVVQVNGKLRAKLMLPLDLDKELVLERVLQENNVKRYTDGKSIKKTIYVPNKLVNIVVA